ncbi:hypothetical protein [Streptomyces atratus]|uniref:hypothetical protein n=1 Tax=Streptomyces atratus TaxID=1893 RepID=UPI003653C985
MSQATFRSVGVFDEYEDATALIGTLPKILAELGLKDRFTVDWAPARVVERQQRGRWSKVHAYYEVRIRDLAPELPPPSITALDIAQAKERLEQRERDEEERERQEAEELAGYTAFGRCQPIAAWARVFSTTVPTVERYKKQYGDLETALTQIALKKHNAA